MSNESEPAELPQLTEQRQPQWVPVNTLPANSVKRSVTGMPTQPFQLVAFPTCISNSNCNCIPHFEQALHIVLVRFESVDN